MEQQRIKQILHSYFEGETTEQEEQLLIDYFRSDQIDPELIQYKAFFAGFEELTNSKRDLHLEESIMDHILEQEHREKTHYRWLWQTVSGIAAALLIALLAVNYYGNSRQWQDTYSNPDQAYVEASRTLQYVAGYYQKGIGNLKPVKKLNEAVTPLNKSITTLEKGFKQVEQLEKVKEKIKQE